MVRIPIKKIQTRISHYFSSVGGMTKAALRCLREMTMGILKFRTVPVNRIAASFREWTGVKSILAIRTVAIYTMTYKKTRAMHTELLPDSGCNYPNKNVPRELRNFIYYKIGEVVSNPPMPVRMRWNPMDTGPYRTSSQLTLMFN